ncbi:WxL protein host-binding domain-containing protein [Lacticaseibacillus baoqingensis]|uniref:WxL protein host-binding domain-containing protein n=1 Tax=Lacticaseibacillus baoqingensis TaxID=2486013 RepID=A0ABW4E212_9LACO|nr:DUF3324 domain-containing protein [Lacticaseibacillus baoqingensis]
MADGGGEFDLGLGGQAAMSGHNWRMALLGLVIGLALGGRQVVQAATSTFMIRPELPSDNRVGQAAGYFDLKAHQDTRAIAVRVYNPAKSSLKLQVALLKGTNGTNGALRYQPAPKADQRLVSYPHQVTLAPKAMAQIRFTLPKRAALGAGSRLWAVQLTSMPKTNSDAVVNRVQYRIGLIVSGQAVQTLHKAKVVGFSPRVKLQHPKPQVTLENLDPVFLRSVTLHATWQHARLGWLNYHQTRTGLKWAPRGRLPVALPFAGEHLQPGVYAVKLQLKTDHWHQTLTRFVRVNAKGRITLSDQAAYRRSQRWWWGIIAIIIGLVVSGGFWQWQRRKRHA